MDKYKLPVERSGFDVFLYPRKGEPSLPNSVDLGHGILVSGRGVPGNVMNFHPGNGQKRALLIGINYIGQKGQLRGCVNDVNTMRSFIEAHGYSQQV